MRVRSALVGSVLCGPLGAQDYDALDVVRTKKGEEIRGRVSRYYPPDSIVVMQGEQRVRVDRRGGGASTSGFDKAMEVRIETVWRNSWSWTPGACWRIRGPGSAVDPQQQYGSCTSARTTPSPTTTALERAAYRDRAGKKNIRMET